MGLLFALLFSLAACGSLAGGGEPPVPTPMAPQWSESELEDHLQFFNSPEVAGRATGTQGYGQSVAYVAARMREFGLQPALGNEFRIVYHTPISYPVEAAVLVLGSDTLRLQTGVDVLPDGRTDADSLRVEEVVAVPASAVRALGPGMLGGQVALLSAAEATAEVLERVRKAGARAVLLVGPLTPRVAPRPTPGLLVMQVAPAAAEQALGDLGVVAAWADRAEPFRRRLPQPLVLQTRVAGDALAGALNTMGFVPGEHPTRAHELVIVCADLDAVGYLAGVPTLDAERLGVSAAALLELARHYGVFASYTTVPERTILFALWSGSQLKHAGLRAFLERPLWSLDAITDVVYVGLRPAEEPAVRALLGQYGLPFRAVSLPEGLPAEGAGPRLLPAASSSRRASADVPDLSTLLEAAVQQAAHLAADAHRVVLRATMTPAPFRPVPPRVPPTPPN